MGLPSQLLQGRGPPIGPREWRVHGDRRAGPFVDASLAEGIEAGLRPHRSSHA